MKSRLRAHAARATAIAIIVVAAALARPPAYSASDRAQLASQFSFRELSLQSASTARPRSVRAVQPQLRRISAWISSVGAAVALSDADRDGLPNDTCLVDPRTDSVTVASAPTTGRRFRPFLLDAAPLPYDRDTMAPMGCLPGDFNEDGRPDMLVYYWGRTPVLFLRRPAGVLGPKAFDRRELVAGAQRWFTDCVTSADIDGDGHLDLIVGNYFPDGARVLDARATRDPRMQMQDSMSRSYNGGTDRILLSTAARAGRHSDPLFREATGALSRRVADGWTLAVGVADLTGDAKPELYFANDFGPDRLLVNRSTPGRVRLSEVTGRRGFATPGSKVLGHDSFKGMGVDFGDLDGDGLPDIVVSNIAATFALQESNLAFLNTGRPLAAGRPAPFAEDSERLGLAHSGWGWDVKLGDFNNDGTSEVVQATGFISGRVNRWPELHELATSNDGVLRFPWAWPRFAPGDDLSGHDPNAFYVRGPTGRFTNIASLVGVGDTHVTRGIATADVDGDGRLDFATAGQWAPSHLYLNRATATGAFLGLDLRMATGRAKPATQVLRYPSRDLAARPAVGAAVRVLLPDGRRLIGQVDGGNGHASVRAPQLLFGLGRPAPRELHVEIAWRASGGEVRRATLRLTPSWHTIVLGDR
jgi:enediyne biosynthesis protein E4